MFVSCEPERDEVLEALSSARGRIRTLLSRALDWRIVPELDFRIDRSTDEAERIARALENAPRRLPSRRTRRATPSSEEPVDDGPTTGTTLPTKKAVDEYHLVLLRCLDDARHVGKSVIECIVGSQTIATGASAFATPWFRPGLGQALIGAFPSKRIVLLRPTTPSRSTGFASTSASASPYPSAIHRDLPIRTVAHVRVGGSDAYASDLTRWTSPQIADTTSSPASWTTPVRLGVENADPSRFADGAARLPRCVDLRARAAATARCDADWSPGFDTGRFQYQNAIPSSGAPMATPWVPSWVSARR